MSHIYMSGVLHTSSKMVYKVGKNMFYFKNAQTKSELFSRDIHHMIYRFTNYERL